MKSRWSKSDNCQCVSGRGRGSLCGGRAHSLRRKHHHCHSRAANSGTRPRRSGIECKPVRRKPRSSYSPLTEEVTIRIDSKRLDQLDAERDESKDDATKRLREIIDTVGKPGKPGSRIRCVVSVSMLTEGWDANTVSPILGVRAFASQRLCEQVVRRGLRRRSYQPDPKTGLLPAEYVDVYGIPFSLIPYKGQPNGFTEPPWQWSGVFGIGVHV